MKTFNRILWVAIAFLFVAACSPAATATPAQIQVNNPYAPQPGDDALRGDEIRIDSASVTVVNSQATLNFAYFQPTPCHQLRVVVSQPDAQNRVNVKAYSVTEKDKPCNMLMLATPLNASLDLGRFPKGHYSIWLNDKKVDEFDS